MIRINTKRENPSEQGVYMAQVPSRPTYAVIDLGAIQHNLTRMRAISGAPVMAVVKANAYGHGAVEVARAAAEAGVSWLGVAFAAEGIALRQAGLGGRILVLGYTPAGLAAEAIENDLSLAVYDLDLAREYSAAAQALGRTACLHVKVDTGMGRLGLFPEDAARLVRDLRPLPGLHVEGLFTHFATANSADPAYAQNQLARFQSLVAELEADRLRPPVVHASNSAAGLFLDGAKFDLIRMGISMYGLHPSGEVQNPPDFRPALAWKTCISQLKTLPPGHSVSYGRIYYTQGEERIAILPVGYADGYRRNPPGQSWVLVGGRRAPVVGRVCMDQIMVNVDGIQDLRRDDEVVLIGRQGEAEITAEEVAGWWDTINYEVTSGIMARVPRLYET